jgi:hypothetical protein
VKVKDVGDAKLTDFTYSQGVFSYQVGSKSQVCKGGSVVYQFSARNARVTSRGRRGRY